MKILRAFTIFILIFLWTPLLGIVKKGASLEAFQILLERKELMRAFQYSLLLAGSSAILTTVMGVCTAFAIKNSNNKVKKWANTSILLPLVLPEIAFGISFLVWFQFLHITLGWITLLLAHMAFTFSYSILVLKVNVNDLDPSLPEAAQDLGAQRLQIFRHGILPQILPGIIASFLMCFSLSLDDFLISFFVKGIEQVTLPIKIYSMMRLRLGSEIYALSLVLFVISLISVVLTQLWIFKSKQSRS